MRHFSVESRGHRVFRASLFFILLLNESAWFLYRHVVAGVALVDNLPLHLCDISVVLVLFTLATGRRRMVELSYFAGVSGALMAVCVPAITESGAVRLLAEIRYFITHIALIGAGLYFTFGRRYYPTSGAVLRSYVAIHIYALLITPVNLSLGTNYFFTVAVPTVDFLQQQSHWLFLTVGSLSFLFCFSLMYLPFAWMRRAQKRFEG